MVCLKKNNVEMWISRTGSSFVGDVLTASSNSTFVYEPLYLYEPFGQPINNKATWNASIPSKIEEFIQGIFDCDNVITLICCLTIYSWTCLLFTVYVPT